MFTLVPLGLGSHYRSRPHFKGVATEVQGAEPFIQGTPGPPWDAAPEWACCLMEDVDDQALCHRFWEDGEDECRMPGR